MASRTSSSSRNWLSARTSCFRLFAIETPRRSSIVPSFLRKLPSSSRSSSALWVYMRISNRYLAPEASILLYLSESCVMTLFILKPSARYLRPSEPKLLWSSFTIIRLVFVSGASSFPRNQQPRGVISLFKSSRDKTLLQPSTYWHTALQPSSPAPTPQSLILLVCAQLTVRRASIKHRTPCHPSQSDTWNYKLKKNIGKQTVIESLLIQLHNYFRFDLYPNHQIMGFIVMDDNLPY